MGKILNTKFKKGAASFFIVASATLILLVIATSFAAIIISSVTRSSNDDLSQSAYDSALAGVEDAKIAYRNYEKCVAQGATAVASAEEAAGLPAGDCRAIIYYAENPSCDSVANMIGRNIVDGAVVITESNIGNNMQQAYTCVSLNASLADYRSTLSSTNQVRVIKAKFDGVDAKQIKSVKISWFSDVDASDYAYENYVDPNAVFPASGFAIKTASPPTISIALVQATDTFSLEDFNRVQDAGGVKRTNRGMLYLVPTDTSGAAAQSKEGNHYAGYDANYEIKDIEGNVLATGANHITTDGFYRSNSKVTRNLPYTVYCPPKNSTEAGEFACNVTIDLPEPINGERSNENFLFAVALPYGKPATDFSLEFYCDDTSVCNTITTTTVSEEGVESTTTTPTNRANLSAVQIEIDSTGRANDLYRRVQARLEGTDDFSLSLMGPLELLGKQDEDVLNKTYTVIREHNFQ